jgi:hypothetical protein
MHVSTKTSVSIQLVHKLSLVQACFMKDLFHISEIPLRWGIHGIFVTDLGVCQMIALAIRLSC